MLLGRRFDHILSDVPVLELDEPLTADCSKWWSDDNQEETEAAESASPEAYALLQGAEE
jgi:hypothetical protein